MLSLTLLATLPLLATSALASYGVVDLPQQGRFERRIAPANSTISLVERSSIEKRAYSGRATWYQAGLGACGGVNSASDKIVALGQVIWDTQPPPNGNPNLSSWCNKKICISYAGKSQEATIVDLCPYSGGCSASDGAALDMSESLFSEFAGLGLGVFQMTWTMGGCGGDDSPAPVVPAAPAPVPIPEVKVNTNNVNNDQAAQQAQQKQQEADDAAQAAQQQAEQAAASKKAAADAAWASQQAASSSSLANAQYLASVASQSSADAAEAYGASVASVARQARISSQSLESAWSARSERIESRSEASVASVQSVRSERIESISVLSVQSLKSESRSSASAASTSVAPVMDAMADVYSNLAMMLAPETSSPAPSARPSRS